MTQYIIYLYIYYILYIIHTHTLTHTHTHTPTHPGVMREGSVGGTQVILFRAVKPFHMILQWWIYVIINLLKFCVQHKEP